MQVTLTTIAELYNDNDTINHHGVAKVVNNPASENGAEKVIEIFLPFAG